MDAINAYRNVIADTRWWRIQLVPIIDPYDDKLKWGIAPTLEFGKKDAGAKWCGVHTAVLQAADIWWDRKNAQLPCKPCTKYGLRGNFTKYYFAAP